MLKEDDDIDKFLKKEEKKIIKVKYDSKFFKSVHSSSNLCFDVLESIDICRVACESHIHLAKAC